MLFFLAFLQISLTIGNRDLPSGNTIIEIYDNQSVVRQTIEYSVLDTALISVDRIRKFKVKAPNFVSFEGLFFPNAACTYHITLQAIKETSVEYTVIWDRESGRTDKRRGLQVPSSRDGLVMYVTKSGNVVASSRFEDVIRTVSDKYFTNQFWTTKYFTNINSFDTFVSSNSESPPPTLRIECPDGQEILRANEWYNLHIQRGKAGVLWDPVLNEQGQKSHPRLLFEDAFSEKEFNPSSISLADVIGYYSMLTQVNDLNSATFDEHKKKIHDTFVALYQAYDHNSGLWDLNPYLIFSLSKRLFSQAELENFIKNVSTSTSPVLKSESLIRLAKIQFDKADYSRAQASLKKALELDREWELQNMVLAPFGFKPVYMTKNLINKQLNLVLVSENDGKTVNQNLANAEKQLKTVVEIISSKIVNANSDLWFSHEYRSKHMVCDGWLLLLDEKNQVVAQAISSEALLYFLTKEN